MEFVLIVIGIAILVFSLIAGLLLNSLLAFMVSLVIGFALAMIFFALSKILENQKNIMGMLEYQYSQDIKARNTEKKICTKCNTTYDPDYTSCPHCGNRD